MGQGSIDDQTFSTHADGSTLQPFPLKHYSTMVEFRFIPGCLGQKLIQRTLIVAVKEQVALSPTINPIKFHKSV
jgi:hypothetical protein